MSMSLVLEDHKPEVNAKDDFTEGLKKNVTAKKRTVKFSLRIPSSPPPILRPSRNHPTAQRPYSFHLSATSCSISGDTSDARGGSRLFPY